MPVIRSYTSMSSLMDVRLAAYRDHEPGYEDPSTGWDSGIYLLECLPSLPSKLHCQHEPVARRKSCFPDVYCHRSSCLICRYYPFDQALTAHSASQKKPYSAITVQIDRLTSEQYEEDDIGGIIDLVEVIRIQASGPTEAARALRKKLKYGSTHRQLRALVILDGLIDNAGSRFQRAFADEPLLERLRLLARDEMVDQQVRQKCKILFTQWATAYKNTPGLQSIANLYKELPKSKRPERPAAARLKVLQDTQPADPDDEPTPTSRHARASSSATSPPNPVPVSRPVTLTPTSPASFGTKSSKNKKGPKPFNLAKEKENMTTCIARASIASTNLLNGLQLVNRETERVSENKEVVNRFDICKSLRRQILMYIQHVESDEWIGSLVNANDELVKALSAYEILDRSVDDDSDSDGWEKPNIPPTKHARNVSSDAHAELEGLTLAASPPDKPPRPVPAAAPAHDDPDENGDDDDEDNPFGDSNAVATPHNELRGMTWKEV